MALFAAIEKDHKKVLDLFKKLASTKSADTCNKVFLELKEELELHSHAEEQVLYAALKEIEATNDIALEAMADHRLVAERCQELADMPKATEEWQEQLQVLRENVEGHIEEEESEIFASVRQSFNDEQLDGLSQRWEEARHRHKSRVSYTPPPETAGRST
jgi:hemerythrin superfamily protein